MFAIGGIMGESSRQGYELIEERISNLLIEQAKRDPNFRNILPYERDKVKANWLLRALKIGSNETNRQDALSKVATTIFNDKRERDIRMDLPANNETQQEQRKYGSDVTMYVFDELCGRKQLEDINRYYQEMDRQYAAQEQKNAAPRTMEDVDAMQAAAQKAEANPTAASREDLLQARIEELQKQLNALKTTEEKPNAANNEASSNTSPFDHGN
jgi:hypothetical protein